MKASTNTKKRTLEFNPIEGFCGYGNAVVKFLITSRIQTGTLYPVGKMDSCRDPPDFSGHHRAFVGTMCLKLPELFHNISRLYLRTL
jgi:hypothetical protein